jgi:hypothetical protein
MTAVAVASVFAAAGASAQGYGPAYSDPAPVYQGPPPDSFPPGPPVYVQPVAPPPVYYGPPPAYYPPPPGYYAPAPGYYGPPPGYRGPPQGDWRTPARPAQARLSDMQQRALDNCSLLAPRDQPRCRATVMSTVR